VALTVVILQLFAKYAMVVQLVERLVANEKVAGSNPVHRSTVIENDSKLVEEEV
jgi:hypothetical protein